MTPPAPREPEPDGRADAAAAPEEAPWWNPANLLTLLRVALVPVIAVLLLEGGTTAQWWAFGIFVFAAATDSIDGWVARRSLGVTRWGQLADPAADKALIVGSLGILAYLGRLPWWAVGVIVVREVAVTVLRTVLARRGVVMPASVFGKAKTVSQVVAVTLYLLPGVAEVLRTATLGLAVALTVASGLEYIARGRRLRDAG
jgi:CDP-diacylglycerol---glycerol-3-phosphate 3-phosphatidyltransferase